LTPPGPLAPFRTWGSAVRPGRPGGPWARPWRRWRARCPRVGAPCISPARRRPLRVRFATARTRRRGSRPAPAVGSRARFPVAPVAALARGPFPLPVGAVTLDTASGGSASRVAVAAARVAVAAARARGPRRTGAVVAPGALRSPPPLFTLGTTPGPRRAGRRSSLAPTGPSAPRGHAATTTICCGAATAGTFRSPGTPRCCVPGHRASLPAVVGALPGIGPLRTPAAGGSGRRVDQVLCRSALEITPIRAMIVTER
jgi:hypothetical protein